MDSSKEIVLAIKIRPVENKAYFQYELEYMPFMSGAEPSEIRASEHNYTFSSTFPWPNPEGEGSEQKFGFGTFNGYCIKPIYFDIE